MPLFLPDFPENPWLHSSSEERIFAAAARLAGGVHPATSTSGNDSSFPTAGPEAGCHIRLWLPQRGSALRPDSEETQSYFLGALVSSKPAASRTVKLLSVSELHILPAA